MPVYVYRREDGTTFELRQSFNDAALLIDAATGQKVSRVVQSTGVVFKGSGFYVNDSKSGSRNNATSPVKAKEGEAAKTDTVKTDGAKSETPAATTESAPAKAETRSEAKSKSAAD